MQFSAGNAILNRTIDDAHVLMSNFQSAGLSPALFVNPVPDSGGSVGGLIAESDFVTNNVPTDGTPLYLQLQFPGDQTYVNTYNVGLIINALGSGWATVTDAATLTATLA